VVSPEAAALALDILADPDARIPGFGLRTPFDWPFRAAAKTGTSRHFTDNWAVAVTEGFTVAVWAGNFNGRPMEGVSGVSGAGPLLHRAVLVTAARYAPGDLRKAAAAGLVPATICRISGMLASPECPPVTEYFLPGTVPTTTCDWHRDGAVRLPAEYAEWSATEGGTSHPSNGEALARLGRPVPGVGRATRLTITSPERGDQYRIPPGVDPRYATIALRASGAPAGVSMRWLVDGRMIPGGRWRLVAGRHRLRVEAGSASDEVDIDVE
jgi:penicillin-binding protein 1C